MDWFSLSKFAKQGSYLEPAASALARRIIEMAKNGQDVYRGTLSRFVNEQFPGDLSNASVVIQFQVNPYLRGQVSCTGHYAIQPNLLSDDTSSIQLNVKVPQLPVHPSLLSELYRRVRFAARHELEHFSQFGENYDRMYGAQVPRAPKAENPEGWLSYLLNPKEVEANAVAAYQEAKKMRRPVEQTVFAKVNWWVLRVIPSLQHGTPAYRQAINQITNAWMNVIRQRFPAAITSPVPQHAPIQSPAASAGAFQPSWQR